MDLQLRDHVVLVIGGTGLIGSAVVERLREEGATAVVASRHPGDDGIRIDAADENAFLTGNITGSVRSNHRGRGEPRR